ncbi:MAG: bacteriohopanetetrol glucosamine biosynthesis glycosyltransferase HpnI [Burkholderiales bacterium]
MLRSLLGIASTAALIAAAGGIGYVAFALQRVIVFGHRRAGSIEGETPPVTILKPVAGLEAELYENLCSFCEQQYPQYQVVFGVRDRDDPAIPVIARVLQAFPSRDLELVAGDGTATAANPKIANLSNMLGHAKHDMLVIADADMRVDPSYLQTIVAPFGDPMVGAVTCTYDGVPRGGFASTLGAMYINEQFTPSVLVATVVEKLTYCFGATMAVRRDVLQKIGGFGALAAHLGDDYMLGRLVTDKGYSVGLAPYVVRNIVHETNVRALWEHELRWARTVCAQRPLSYAFLFLTFPVPTAALFLLLSRNLAFGLVLLAGAMAVRVALQSATRNALGLSEPARPWLIPVRDAFSLAIWVASFLGRGVRWRKQDFTIRSNGRLG